MFNLKYPSCGFNEYDNNTTGNNSNSYYNDANNNTNNGNTDFKHKNICTGNIHFVIVTL